MNPERSFDMHHTGMAWPDILFVPTLLVRRTTVHMHNGTYFSKLKRKDKGLKDNLTHIEFAPTKEITGKKLRLKRQLCTCRVAPTKEITGKIL